MNRCMGFVSSMCVAAFLVSSGLGAEGKEIAAGPPLVLDAYSYWRTFPVFCPAVFAEKVEGAQTPEGRPRTDPPPADWAAADFDDSCWFRTTGPLWCGTWGGYGWVRQGGGALDVSMVCVRGKFSVPDPAKVESLTLSAEYRGGIVVYLNGREFVRAHIGEGALTPETLAKEYPWEAYVKPDGKSAIDYGDERTDEITRRLELRFRRLNEVAVPVSHLRKGVNVLAVEIHRSPVHPDSDKFKKRWKHKWSTVGLRAIALAASPEASVQHNATRPAGIQVWNENSIADVYVTDYGDPNEPVRPIQMVGVRNGSFSGWVVVGSDMPVRGLGASMSALETKDGAHRIAADAIRIRYSLPMGYGGQKGRAYIGLRWVSRFDGLAESPPAEVPILKVEPERGYTGPLPVFGAVQPVRVTVRVPADTAPGEYHGTLTVKAEGLGATAVPVCIEVIDWTLPDPSELSTHIGVIQSIESLAIKYETPLWSEKHWKLIERSFGLLGEAGVDTLFLPLLARHHFGKEGLVRWVKKDDGTFSHDYTLFEKYVDTALEHVKKPEVVCLYFWDPEFRAVDVKRPKNPRTMPPPLVPLLDEVTGEVTEMECPRYNTEACVAFWKPVLDTCHAKLIERGVDEKVIMTGMSGDRTPAKEEVELLHRAAPWAEWVVHSHGPGSTLAKIIPVGHSAAVWGATSFGDPAGWRQDTRHFDGQGWKTKKILTAFPRTGAGPSLLHKGTSLSGCLLFQESCLLAGIRGVARVGAEFWNFPVLGRADARGSQLSLVGRYSSWGRTSMGNCAISLLVPGPEGALLTTRLAVLHEGAQVAEARVFIEKAMESHKNKLAIDGMSPEETRAKLKAMLDERARMHIAYRPIKEWYAGSNWEDRAAELYRAAAGVARAIGKPQEEPAQ